MPKLAETLHYKGVAFHFVGFITEELERSRVYESPGGFQIRTAIGDYDGILIGSIDKALYEPDDDGIRHFHWATGIEE